MLEDLKSYVREMGYSKINDFRDILHSNIRTAGELLVYNGDAEVDPEKYNACGLCWSIGHCWTISQKHGITTIDREQRLTCSTCVDIFPRNAIDMKQL